MTFRSRGATDLFVFRDAAACCSWRDCGRTTENGTGMIHLMVDPGGLTVVVDNPTEHVAASVLKEIDGLLGRLDILSPSPAQAPTISAPKEEKKTMKNFRAREVVQAVKWENLSSYESEIERPTPPPGCIWKQNEENKLWYLFLETDDGVEQVHASDWVVTTSIGEHHVHSDMTFRALYQAIDPPAPRTAKFEVSLTVADLGRATAVEADEVEVEDNGQLVFFKDELDEDGDLDDVEVARFNGPCWAYYKRADSKGNLTTAVVVTPGASGPSIRYPITFSQEVDGRWIAGVDELPGVRVYGKTMEEAASEAEKLALQVVTDRMKNGEKLPLPTK
jgi:predicted RNase H-like HicB family nuclease